mgnify:CR=1 FL=1
MECRSIFSYLIFLMQSVLTDVMEKNENEKVSYRVYMWCF